MNDVLPAIEAAIRSATGNAFRLEHTTPISGGFSGQTLSVANTDGSARYFVKLAGVAEIDRFDAEIDGLQALAADSSFRIPAVVAHGTAAEHAFLVLEHLDLRPLASPDDGQRFATALARLHGKHAERYGWHRANYIGPNPQDNTWHDNWPSFFAHRRIQPQLDLAARQSENHELVQLGARLIDRIAALLLDYRPRPALLHGDLWHGNAAMLADGTPALFDPACHYGDRESELAMCELFGGFPLAFHAHYRQYSPLSPDYEQRKPLYQLYHILNHLNLFGRGYLGQALRFTKQVLRETSGHEF